MILDDDQHRLGAKIQELERDNAKLSRELRVLQSYLDKVTKTIEAKEALGNALTVANAKQKAYTDMLLESCPNIMVLLDEYGRFVLSTKMLLVEIGIHNFDMIRNRTYAEVWAKHMEPALLAKLKAAIDTVIHEKTSVVLNEWIDFSQNNRQRYYTIELMSVSGAKGGDAGISAGVLAVFVDHTDFMREKQRAEEANNAKSDFLAQMSHEIRTPMNAILGMTEVLSRSELSPQHRRYISDIQHASQSLLAIINDILDFSKIEAGKLDIIWADYNLIQLLESLYSMFSVLYQGKNLKLNFTVGPNVPTFVHGDENRLRQILTNLLSNALKYTPAGKVDFTAWLSEDNKLRFDVQDTGIGIRETDVPQLFTPFEQLDLEQNRHVEGTGLGLAISYRLCVLLEGELWFKSEYGQGSLFSVALPYKPANPGFSGKKEQKLKEFTAPAAKVLVVDDMEINLYVAEALLNSFEIQPTLALSGAEALELVQSTEFELIFMDHMMPNMDGLQTAANIRSLGGYCTEVPIIALTANAMQGMEKMYLTHQFNGYLPKPLEFSSLNLCLRKWLPAEILQFSDLHRYR